MCARNRPTTRKGSSHVSRQALIAALSCVEEHRFADFKPHGNTKWRAFVLLQLAVLWAWETGPSLGTRWQQATRILSEWFPDQFVGTSYGGFIHALARWTEVLLAALCETLHQRIEKVAGARYWSTAGYPTFAIDGSKVAVPWSHSTDRHLGNQTLTTRAKRRRKKRRRRSANSRAHLDMRPQILLTLAWHLGTGLPWAWKLGPLGDSEREQARGLLPQLPPQSLLVMDAGFTGYEFWSDVLKAGHHLVVRVGSNVKLLSKLGWKVRTRGEFVFLWPDQQRKQQAPPLVLRLVALAGPRHTVYVATTLLSAHALSDRQVGQLYRQRWGIEGWFRSLKQTFGRGKMRSLTADHALCELQWSIVGLGLIQLQGVEALVADGQHPHDLSEAAAIRVVCSTVLHGDFTCQSLPKLRTRLLDAVVDHYQRRAPKAGRHVHRQRLTTPTGEPKLIPATIIQRHAARQLQILQRAA